MLLLQRYCLNSPQVQDVAKQSFRRFAHSQNETGSLETGHFCRSRQRDLVLGHSSHLRDNTRRKWRQGEKQGASVRFCPLALRQDSLSWLLQPHHTDSRKREQVPFEVSSFGPFLRGILHYFGDAVGAIKDGSCTKRFGCIAPSPACDRAADAFFRVAS